MKNLEAVDSILIIEKMIQNAQKRTSTAFMYFIYWGILVSCMSILHFISYHFQLFHMPLWAWPVVMLIGNIPIIIMARKQANHSQTKNKFDIIVQHIWIVLGFGFLIILCWSIYFQQNPTIFMMMLSGIGMYLTSVVLESKNFKIGSLFLLLGVVLCFIIPGYYHLIICSFSLFLSFVMMGWKEYKKINSCLEN